MKVWIVLESIPYEGRELRGVYATEEVAQEAINRFAKKERQATYRYDWEEHDVQYDVQVGEEGTEEA